MIENHLIHLGTATFEPNGYITSNNASDFQKGLKSFVINNVCKKILVDMSATLIHHGHIRLLKKASKLGIVIVALTRDSEIKKYKNYSPELNFNQRKEILESIKTMDGSYDVLPGDIIEYNDEHAIQKIKDDNKK